MQALKDPNFIQMEFFRSSGVLKWAFLPHFNTPDGNFWEFQRFSASKILFNQICLAASG
ncbi:MAG: hypothetical protein K2L45_02325 [Muribaculaceae bacterium]|nr:hypothetical protein [Muribaculaceae bacterium]